ncbi:unnamed protein product, partial [Rotaria magnacalcarata]
MAEKIVATLLSKTLEQIPKYSGKPDQDADKWMKQALKIISTFLEGHPKQWFNENTSNRLRTRQQRYDVTVIEYYTDVIKLCKLVDPNMTDASKLDHLYHGLKPSLMKDVLRGAPLTP